MEMLIIVDNPVNTLTMICSRVLKRCVFSLDHAFLNVVDLLVVQRATGVKGVLEAVGRGVRILIGLWVRGSRIFK